MLIPVSIYVKTYSGYIFEKKLYFNTVPRKDEYITVNDYNCRVKFTIHDFCDDEHRIALYCTIERYGYDG